MREADAEEIAIGDTRSLQRTMVYVSQFHTTSRPYHCAHLRKLYSVRVGTHDGRVVHSAHLREKHSFRFGTHDGRLARSARLRKLHFASRYPCSSTCHHLWCTTFIYGALPGTYSAPSVVFYAVPLAAALDVTYMGEAASVAPASAITYGAAPAMTTYEAPSHVAPAMTYSAGC